MQQSSVGVLLLAAVVVGGVAVPSLAGTAAGADTTELSKCTAITESGTYVLTSDIEKGGKTAISGTCIDIRASDVVFDGGGHTIDGRGESHTVGVGVNGSAQATNVTVRNVTVTDWHAGVALDNATDGTVQSVNASSNAYGVKLVGTENARLSGNTLSRNLVGVDHAESNSSRLADNTFDGNELDTIPKNATA